MKGSWKLEVEEVARRIGQGATDLEQHLLVAGREAGLVAREERARARVTAGAEDKAVATTNGVTAMVVVDPSLLAIDGETDKLARARDKTEDFKREGALIREVMPHHPGHGFLMYVSFFVHLAVR
jgi:hypothetical protein